MQKKIVFTLIVLMTVGWSLSAQTSMRVYQIMQDKCAGCHSGANPAGELDLKGSGMGIDVYNKLYEGTPKNAHAAQKDYDLIYPGRPDKSYVFRLVEDGMEPFIEMDAAEMPTTSHDNEALGLTDTEKELMRQWILYGAPLDGEVVSESLLDNYYTNGGLESFPEGRPSPPDPAKGFQVKMGPFFLEPGTSGEVEYFQKYELDNDIPLEITRIENLMDGSSSHHFILYDYNSADAAADQKPGLRLNPDHINVGLVEAVQDPTDLKLPEGAAFFWDKNKVLDLNSHYINYNNVPYKSEVYLNIYYQESGIAKQEMHSDLIANFICIPNNGDPYSVQDIVTSEAGGLEDIYIWGLSGHTHQLGRGYKIWRRENGEATELLYDASCWNGEPDCASPYYDYRHIPFRYFDDFVQLDVSPGNGFVHEATWVNNTDGVVCWGDTSDDEMMVMIVMFLTDLTGVVTDVENPNAEVEILTANPNPMTESTMISLPDDAGTIDFVLYDVLGNQIRMIQNISDPQIIIDRGNLSAGMYVYHIENEAGKVFSGKLLVQ